MLRFSSIISGPRKHEIHDLPVEILAMVFKYLSEKERKAVRLVCKCWNEICNVPSLSQNGVIYCLGFYKLPDIYELLNRSDRRLLNLKFIGVAFTDDSLFWKMNGSRIRSITFENCQFDKNILREIIYYCVNLLYLAIRFSEYFSLSFPKLANGSTSGIIRKSLQYLEICIHSSNLGDDLIRLFPIFPELKVLKIAIQISNYSPICSAIKDYLMLLRDRIEKLELHFQYMKLPLNEFHCFSKTLTVMERLTELSINCSSLFTPANLDEFLCSKPFKSLEYHRKIHRLPLQSFLVQLLQSNSNLEHLRMFSLDELVITKRLFEAVMSSNLKTIHLDIDGKMSVQDLDSIVSCLSAEYKTTALPSLTLCLSFFVYYPEINIVSFLQCFPNLHHLKIFRMSPNILQSLFKHQRHLKSLLIPNLARQNLIEEYVEMSKPAFNQLPDIERLELEDAITYVFLRSLAPEPVLANLKCLKINLTTYPCVDDGEWVPSLDLLKLADATPFLEALYITENRNLLFDYFCKKVCIKLSRLRLLCWDHWDGNDEGCFYTDEDYRKLLSICSSLRSLFHRHLDQINRYFFNTLNKKITRVEDARSYIFALSAIGGLPLDWLRNS